MKVIDYFIGGIYRYRYRQSGEKCFMDGPHNAYWLTFVLMWMVLTLSFGLICFVYANLYGVIREPWSLAFEVLLINATLSGLVILYMKRRRYAENLFEEIRNMNMEELKRQTKYSLFTVVLPMIGFPMIILLLAVLIKAVLF